MRDGLRNLKKTVRASNVGRSEYIEGLLKSLELKILSTIDPVEQLQALLDFEYALPPTASKKWLDGIESMKSGICTQLITKKNS